MGMELEFIDLSRDEENEISRVSNGPDERRRTGNSSQRRSRPRTPVMIQMEDHRGERPDRQRRRGAEEIQAIAPRRPRPDTQRRPQTQVPGRARPVAPEMPDTKIRRSGSSSRDTSLRERGNVKRRPRSEDPRVERERAIRRRRRRRRRIAARMGTMLFLISLIVGSVFLLYKLLTNTAKEKEPQAVINATTVNREEVIEANEKTRPDIMEDFLTVNEYSRPGEPLEEVNNIFVHYTANPGTSAAQNRSYFENLGITGETSASAHFVIGYDGEIVQCIPLDEIAYAVMKRNYDSISIECCYLTDDGKFTEATYQSLIQLSAWLLNEYNLAPEDMRRHYDEGGKKCPLYYVEHEEAWEQFLRDLENYIMKEQV